MGQSILLDRLLNTRVVNVPNRGWVMFASLPQGQAALIEDECGVPLLLVRTWGLEGGDPQAIATEVGFEVPVSVDKGSWGGCEYTEFRFGQNPSS